VGGELYGGSMFVKSAANDSLQSKAIHSINERWNVNADAWKGRETIGIPVCKKKYAPFDIKVRRVENGQVKVTVERMYGCCIHSQMRKKVIEEHGERDGWEPFGQWSMSKARSMVRRELDRICSGRGEGRDDRSSGGSSSESSSSDSSDSETDIDSPSGSRGADWKSVCHNGMCAWKLKGKYDDVFDEIQAGEDTASMYLDEAALRNGSGISAAYRGNGAGG